MFNLFPPFGATTAIFNDAPQPWQVGFLDGASPPFSAIYCTTLAFVLSIPVLISCKDTYREKYNKQLNIVANVLICISIICIYYLVSIYLGVGPIECAPELDHQLELLKDTNKSITKNTKAAFVAYTGMLTMVAGSLLKVKAGSPALKGTIFLGSAVVGGHGISGMLNRSNKAHMANMNGAAFARKATNPSTFTTAAKGEQLLGK